MRPADYAVFQRVAQTELPAGMWLQDWASDPHYPLKMSSRHSLAKLRDLNSDYYEYKRRDSHNGMQLDIFLAGLEGCNKRKAPSCCEEKTSVVNICFENRTVLASANWEQVLAAEYGPSWRKPAPIDQRKPHEGRVAFEAPAWVKTKYPDLPFE